MSDLKEVANWTFTVETINSFFDIITSELCGKYDAYYANENKDSRGILLLDVDELIYLESIQFAPSIETVVVPLRGVGNVTSKYEKFFQIDDAEMIDDNNGAATTVDENKLNAVTKRGIFFLHTVETIVTSLYAKCNLGIKFKICFIGLYNVVNISRLIQEFESSGVLGSVSFDITVIELLPQKCNDLGKLLTSAKLKNTQVNFITKNFLEIHNSEFQQYNCVLCFLNQSCSRLFGLKFMLLQLYCSREQENLQLILSSKRVNTTNKYI